jgi:hypothetical protein
MIRSARAALAMALAALLVAGAAPTARANPMPSAKEALEQGHTAYDRGDYRHAIDTLQPLLYPSIELGTEDEVVMAHRLLALSYFFVNKQKDAEQEVTSLLALRPNYALDPIVDPPLAVRFFEDVRRRQSERLREVQQREREEAERVRRDEERQRAAERARAERVYVDRIVERHSRFIAMLPFGGGQFQNGQTAKGIVFASAELAFAAVSIGTWSALNLDNRYPLDPTTGHRTFPVSDTTRVTTLTGLQLGSAGAFYALVIWGIIDAQVLFKREVVRGERERRAAPSKSSLHLYPLHSPTLTGVGLQGTF